MTDTPDENRLLIECRDIARHGYAPYSTFYVGALIRTVDGIYHRGANMENISYGVTMCAEVGALTAATVAGDLGHIERLYVAGGKLNAAGEIHGAEIITPCGRCRQLLYEAAAVKGADFEVICSNGDGTQLLRSTAKELLPHGFGPSAIRPKAR